jgi:hypothetical protein
MEGIEAKMEAGLGKDGDQSGKVGSDSECWLRSDRGHLRNVRGQSRKDRGSSEIGGNQPRREEGLSGNAGGHSKKDTGQSRSAGSCDKDC